MALARDGLEDTPTAPTLQEMIDETEGAEEGEDDALIFDTSHDPSLHGLREISSLASWTVSTHKPTCGTHALLAPTPHTFWQSDGPQPHLLTLHFFKLVKIVRLRVYLDFVLDESYTPTKMEFWGGWSSSYGLVQFAEWTGAEPRGWQEISLEGVGVEGRAELRCMVLQVRVIENHQNGKDTHMRGMQVFAVDERVGRDAGLREDVGEGSLDVSRHISGNGFGDVRGEGEGESRGLVEAHWMGDPQLR
ncbi:MAG: hypothetical protein Q9217_001405 [Psora testacea]